MIKHCRTSHVEHVDLSTAVPPSPAQELSSKNISLWESKQWPPIAEAIRRESPKPRRVWRRHGGKRLLRNRIVPNGSRHFSNNSLIGIIGSMNCTRNWLLEMKTMKGWWSADEGKIKDL